MSKFGKGICAHCGKVFERKRGGQVYCSVECRKGDLRAIRDRVDAKLYEGGEDAVCLWCGEWFKRPYKSRKQYCSVACKQKDITARENGKRKKRGRPPKEAKTEHKDGFTWDDIRGVLAEYKISSYHKAIAILEQKKRGCGDGI